MFIQNTMPNQKCLDVTSVYCFYLHSIMSAHDSFVEFWGEEITEVHNLLHYFNLNK